MKIIFKLLAVLILSGGLFVAFDENAVVKAGACLDGKYDGQVSCDNAYFASYDSSCDCYTGSSSYFSCVNSYAFAGCGTVDPDFCDYARNRYMECANFTDIGDRSSCISASGIDSCR